MTKKKIKVVDVVDNDKTDDDAYTVIVDEIKVSNDEIDSVKQNPGEKLEAIKEEQEEETSITEVSESRGEAPDGSDKVASSPIESTKKNKRTRVGEMR